VLKAPTALQPFLSNLGSDLVCLVEAQRYLRGCFLSICGAKRWRAQYGSMMTCTINFVCYGVALLLTMYYMDKSIQLYKFWTILQILACLCHIIWCFKQNFHFSLQLRPPKDFVQGPPLQEANVSKIIRTMASYTISLLKTNDVVNMIVYTTPLSTQRVQRLMHATQNNNLPARLSTSIPPNIIANYPCTYC
jgi:hypothetical protein